MDFQEVLKELKKFSSQQLDITEMEDATVSTSKNLVKIVKHSDQAPNPELFSELVVECSKHLKIMCTKGSSFQSLIVNTTGMLETLKEILLLPEEKLNADQQIKCFQLVANLCVMNKWAQEKIWETMSEDIVAKFTESDNQFMNVAAMIIYNMVLNKQASLSVDAIAKIALNHYRTFLNDPSKSLPDFLHILMDFIFCKTASGLELYQSFEQEDQKTFLFYVHDYVEEESNDVIHHTLLDYFAVEFKRKSDCILKTVSDYVENTDPQFVVLLLDIISAFTTHEKYMDIIRTDRALFLNLGCMLQALHKLGKASDSIFSPITSLDVLAPNSNASSDFEKEISYSFKTKLMQSLANLSYRNKKNQELAREMEIMLSIFDCTNADARNPLIKEWSVLAIRNLCEDNPENQEIVRSLTKVGDAENPLLKELGLESGMLRIGKQ